MKERDYYKKYMSKVRGNKEVMKIVYKSVGVYLLWSLLFILVMCLTTGFFIQNNWSAFLFSVFLQIYVLEKTLWTYRFMNKTLETAYEVCEGTTDENKRKSL